MPYPFAQPRFCISDPYLSVTGFEKFPDKIIPDIEVFDDLPDTVLPGHPLPQGKIIISNIVTVGRNQ